MRSVTPSGIARSLTWSRESKSTSESIEISIDCGSRSGSAFTFTDSIGWASVPPFRVTASDSPTNEIGTSTVSSSDIRTWKRSTWSGFRVTGLTPTPWMRTGVAFPPSTERSMSAFGPIFRRRSSNSWVSSATGRESTPWP